MMPLKVAVVAAGTVSVSAAAMDPLLPTNWLAAMAEASTKVRPPIVPPIPLRSSAPFVPLPPRETWLTEKPVPATPNFSTPFWMAVAPVMVLALARPVSTSALPPMTVRPSFLVLLVNLPAKVMSPTAVFRPSTESVSVLLLVTIWLATVPAAETEPIVVLWPKRSRVPI